MADGALGAAKPLPQSAGTFIFSWSKPAFREVLSATLVLSLGIVGNAILPIPYAFSVTGAVAGVVIFVLTALANRYTCRLLLRGAVASATCDYETLAEAVAGPAMRWAVEVCTVLLLLGTTAGGIIQIGGSAAEAVNSQWPGQATWWTDNNGFWPMVIFTLACVFPLCMLPSMRQLEVVGAVGSLIVFALAIIILSKSCANGLPQLGVTFPIAGFGSLSGIAEAFSLANFGFYLQAMLMPLLGELSPGQKGAAAASKAVTITVLGPALTTYLVAGFFGASMYGNQTDENALQNEWLPGVGTVILNFLMTFYLILSMPPIVFACVYTVRNWVNLASKGRAAKLPNWVARLISTSLVLGVCLGLALAVPGQSGVVLTFTGATFVLAVSYLFPVWFHGAAYTGRARYQRQKAAAEAELAAELAGVGDLELAAKKSAGLDASDGSGEGGTASAGGDGALAEDEADGLVAALPAGATGTASGRADAHESAAGLHHGAHVAGMLAAHPSPFDAGSQLAGLQEAEDTCQLGAIPESGSVELPVLPSGSQGFLFTLSSARRSGYVPGQQSTRRLLLDLLHASNTAAPQRSQELEQEADAMGLSPRGSVDRQAVFRQELLRTSILPQAMASSAPSRALTRMLTTKHLDDEHEEELVLALLPPYRRRAQRHKAVEFLVEVALPAVVLALGLFFSISTLVLLFQ